MIDTKIQIQEAQRKPHIKPMLKYSNFKLHKIKNNVLNKSRGENT